VAQTVSASGQVLNSFSFDAYGAPTGTAPTDPYSGYGGAWGYCITPSGSASHSYGWRADGLRSWKQTASGTDTYFLYDGAQPICEFIVQNGGVNVRMSPGRSRKSADQFSVGIEYLHPCRRDNALRRNAA
jgi:hypothetical protein